MSDVDDFEEVEANLPVINTKRNISEIRVQKDKILTLEDIEALDNDDDEDNDMEIGDNDDDISIEVKEKNSGIIYLQTVPPKYNVAKVREVFNQYGVVKRIHLVPDSKKKYKNPKLRSYTEGWIEFEDKKKAKACAKVLNCTKVGGKRRHPASDTLWSMKYLKGFKWSHLREQLAYEKQIEKKRLSMEISRARKEASHFADQLDKGVSLKKLEEKVLKKGGLWERYQKQIKQRQLVGDKKKEEAQELGKSDDFMHLIFDSK
uniref:Activator of basal transcription 1 n=1 Tax=Strongyloides papillosus TaxID=174720 RepID=A0A0N5CG18_STREA